MVWEWGEMFNFYFGLVQMRGAPGPPAVVSGLLDTWLGRVREGMDWLPARCLAQAPATAAYVTRCRGPTLGRTADRPTRRDARRRRRRRPLFTRPGNADSMGGEEMLSHLLIQKWLELGFWRGSRMQNALRTSPGAERCLLTGQR